MLVFKGPSFKRKIYIQAKIQSYNINEKKTEKVAQNLKRKVNGAMRAWPLASL